MMWVLLHWELLLSCPEIRTLNPNNILFLKRFQIPPCFAIVHFLSVLESHLFVSQLVLSFCPHCPLECVEVWCAACNAWVAQPVMLCTPKMQFCNLAKLGMGQFYCHLPLLTVSWQFGLLFSVRPFAGWYKVLEVICWNPHCFNNSLNSPQSYWGPLSLMTHCGFLCLAKNPFMCVLTDYADVLESCATSG